MQGTNLPQSIEIELSTEHRCSDEKLPTLIRQACHATPDHGTHAGGDPERCFSIGDRAFGVEQTHDLAYKERVPLRLGVYLVDTLGSKLDTGREAYVPANVGSAQPSERDVFGLWLTGELGQRVRKGSPRCGVDIAERAHHEEPAVCDLAGNKLQHEKGGLVGGVQVVQDKQKRVNSRRRGVGTSSLPRTAGSGRLRSLAPAAVVAIGTISRSSGRSCASSGRIVAELLVQRVRVRSADMSAQRLHPRPVGGSASRLPAAADQHMSSAFPGVRDEHLGQRALANAWLSGNEHDLPAPTYSVFERRDEHAQLALSTDERPSPFLRRCRWSGGRSSERSWRRISCCISRSSRPGTSPRSLLNISRASWKASSASAWRPERYRASICCPRKRSRSG